MGSGPSRPPTPGFRGEARITRRVADRIDLETTASGAGYLLPDPDITAFFLNSEFKDVTVRVFARRSGYIVKIFEQHVDRRILSQAPPPERP